MAKVVLITGASSGLGKALAALLHKKGYTVYGTSRNPQPEQYPFTMLRMDVQDEKSVQVAVDQILTQCGRVDVLINNAGIGIAGPLEQLQLESIKTVMDTNFFGVIRLCQAVLPSMRKTGGGRIINISSIAAEIALPYRAIYSASKAAVDRLTDALRMELGPFNIDLCSIQPGDIRTEINDHRIMEYDKEDPTYRATFEKVAKTMNEEVDHGADPLAIAEQIIEIIEKQKIKKTYTLGKPMQKLSLIFKKILPASTFESIIKKYAGV
jgi:NAD(P)-dependent dehydrogenase (short-subunit alcohol dehydrogenase family)